MQLASVSANSEQPPALPPDSGLEPNPENPENPEEDSNSASKAVFFGGMVIAWFVDGAIDYISGSAPSEWVSWGLNEIEETVVGYLSTPLYSSAVVKSGGVVEPNDCTSFPCPITAEDPEKEEEK